MKRRRNSTSMRSSDDILEKGKVSHLQINYSFSDLPNNILVTILLSLSIKSIFVCKCVCKAWYDLISDPKFAILHFNQARVCHLLRSSGFSSLSRMLYLVQPDDFDMRYDTSPITIKLDCKLKLPLRNTKRIRDQDMKINYIKDHKYSIVNSCNGLLCLSKPSNNDPVAVCNPLTGEYINLPVPEVRTVDGDRKSGYISCFGYSPASNQYKVIKMFSRRIGQNEVMVVKVYILGKKTWRVLHFSPMITNVQSPTYLDGCVYWFCPTLYSVLSFDIEKECFGLITLPEPKHMMNLGILGRELCISSRYYDDAVHVWAMKDNSENKAWSQIFSFQYDDDDDDDVYGDYDIKYLNNGALLMFRTYKNLLIYKDPRKTGARYLSIRGFKAHAEVIAHIPSFVPLKHALSGHNMKVLNVNSSRCAELKLQGDEQVISIVEENRKIKCDSKDMDQDCDSE